MTERGTQRLFLFLLLLALARHVWLAFHIHPYADDFSYAAVGMRTDLWERMLSEYRFWNGRYFSNMLVLRNPIVLGLERGLPIYRAVPVLLMALTWSGAYALLRASFSRSLSKLAVCIGSTLFLLVYLNAMPDASEGIYWYTGAVSYQLPSALVLLLAACWVRYFNDPDRRQSNAYWLGMMLLVVVIAGCTELHMAVVVLGHTVILVWRQRTTGSWDRRIVLFFLLSLACAAVVVFAPGNAVRGAHFPMKHVVSDTLLSSALQSGRFIFIWVFTSMLLPLSLVFLAWHRNWHAQLAVEPIMYRMDRWIALALPITVVLLAMVLPYWSTGILGQYRTVNAALFLFLPLWFVALGVWDAQVFTVRWSETFPWKGSLTSALVIGLLFFMWKRDGKVSLDLITGTASHYDKEMDDRFERIESAVSERATEVVLPPIEHMPRSLVILQPEAAPERWMNRSLAEYFGNEDLRIVVAAE